MEVLSLHKAPSRGWLLGNYPVIIRPLVSGEWVVLPFDPTQQEITGWVSRCGFGRQMFRTRREAQQVASLALSLDAPVPDPGEAPCRLIRPGVWQLSYGMEAHKAERSSWWHIHKDGKVVNRAFSLWWAARLAADRGPRFVGMR